MGRAALVIMSGSARCRAAFLIVGIGLAAGCIRFTPASGLKPPPAILDRMVLCASINQKNNWADPVGEKTVFKKGEDANTISFLNFRDFHGGHTLVWKWYDPARRLYRASDGIAVGEDGKVYEKYIAWDMIYVSEEKADGTWTVAVFMDGILLVSKEFEIKSSFGARHPMTEISMIEPALSSRFR